MWQDTFQKPHALRSGLLAIATVLAVLWLMNIFGLFHWAFVISVIFVFMAAATALAALFVDFLLHVFMD